ncbi:MAG: hypothetical protein HY756_02440 [Nitrospirae bacterium]|nr:hypothetical protein [Nitrospirota bacterium]
MKKSLFITLLLTIPLLLSLAACKRKEEQPVPKVNPPAGPVMEAPMEAPMTPPHGTNEASTKAPLQIVVPPDVQGAWSAVKLIVEDRQLNKTQELTAKLGSELKIPNSKLLVKVGDFLPNLTVSGQVITSTSNKPDNPAVGVIVYEDSKKIFPTDREWGWLYANFPQIHPFRHDRFAVTLKEGIKR